MRIWKLFLLLAPSLVLADLVVDGVTDFKAKCYPKTKPLENPLSVQIQNKNIDLLFHNPEKKEFFKHKLDNPNGDYFVNIPRYHTKSNIQIGLHDGIKAVRLTYLKAHPMYPNISQAVQVRFLKYMQKDFCSDMLGGNATFWQHFDEQVNKIVCASDKAHRFKLSYSEAQGFQGDLMLTVNMKCFATLGIIPVSQRSVSITSCFKVEKAMVTGDKPGHNSYEGKYDHAATAKNVFYDKYSDIVNCEQGTNFVDDSPQPVNELDFLKTIVLALYKDALRLIPVVGPVLAKGAEFVELILEHKDKLDHILGAIAHEGLNPKEYKEMKEKFVEDLKKGKSKFLKLRKRGKRSTDPATTTIEDIEGKIAKDSAPNEENPFERVVFDNGVLNPEDIDDEMLEGLLPREDFVNDDIFNSFLT
ncbi:hypothetical protein DFQ28_003111 [Apophysomyces sp. BC1034]|nr:hypothetical protein DFQ30_009969 [Apophysomyces sp. BC1015]KAG0183156.1 hypothetical protein DFQ29_009232 [Apophysomyces sp. BC1021]KAG0189683.1 hypothetical protein DFQ28_003111 [Apophysomyces sp. BC1034]